MPDELFQEPDNATQLTLEERADLIPAHIGYRSELNAAEQENITRGQDWALARKRDLLSEKFIKDLHTHMQTAAYCCEVDCGGGDPAAWVGCG